EPEAEPDPAGHAVEGTRSDPRTSDDPASVVVTGTLSARGRSELAAAHQVQIDAAGGLAAVGDGPDDQGLPALAVAGGEHAGDAGHEAIVDLQVAAGIALGAELVEQAGVLRVHEPHGEQHEVGVDRELGAGHALEPAALQLDAHAVQALDVAVLVTLDELRRNAPVA